MKRNKKASSLDFGEIMASKKTVEEVYQKKTPIEHILLRPDTYIGSVENESQPMYVWDDESGKILQKTINYVPGLYKIFDEIIVNAADNKIRDSKMDMIKITIDREESSISVYNNGKGVPIRMHAREKVYVPELIFGQLLTSSNYDDKEEKVTGGRNGYGAKLCNIFSREFIVETSDSEVGLRYYQRYFNNMSGRDEPVITKCSGSDFTQITFKPDLKRFNMERLDDDFVSLIKKRVYDLSGIVKDVRVFLNGEQIHIRNFKDYVGLYLQSDQKVVHEKVNERWEVVVTLSEEQFQQVSFVNGICTSKGGTHIVHVLDQLIDPIAEQVKKKEKGLVIRPFQVKSCLFLFVNTLIVNPAFDSQTKENMTLRASSFGSRCTISDEFVKNVMKTGIVERITAFAKIKQAQQLRKTDGTKTGKLSGIPKLTDANMAGTRQSQKCTLILTEGDSAKTLAISGLSIVGRDLYGVFPLRGKLLNVREASHKQIMENQEINAIKKILGLQHGKTYETTESLRYGHVMIMTDQDHDGSHIKGLIINFFDHFFPSLLLIPEFLQEFITPIVRATWKGERIDFYTIPEYEKWKEEDPDFKRYSIKYYKGLGTSTAQDARDYFSNISKHVKSFCPLSADDKMLVDLAFNKKKADARKNWLKNFIQGTFLDHSNSKILISDFVNKELILFSMADNVRSIPSVVDGLKPGQRKVIFCCFKRNLKEEIKIAQLVGYVSEKSAYHHGEVSLASTIINLAQDFVGSNNINLLLPIGQFGTRLMGGKDSASPRYIFTSLSPLARLIFKGCDDPILNFLNEDNQSIEPDFYVPIIPMVLVNGAEGIGTGWSTSIPTFCPQKIAQNIINMIDERDPESMIPFYKNFKGTIEEVGEGKYKVSGVFSISGNSMEITELPVGVWTQTYKEFLDQLLADGEIRDFKEYHTERDVNFLIRFSGDSMLSGKKSDVEKKMKLCTTISLSNMVCFDRNGCIKRYDTPIEILREFYNIRLEYYVKRKEQLLRSLREEVDRLENKVSFISEVVNGTLAISGRKRSEIVNDLVHRDYKKIDDDYEYLLSMPILSLTLEKIDKLNLERDSKKNELEWLLSMSPKMLWKSDLEIFVKAYEQHIACERSSDSEAPKRKRKKASTESIRKRSANRKPDAVKKHEFEAPIFEKGKATASKNKTKKIDNSEKPWEKYNVILSDSE